MRTPWAVYHGQRCVSVAWCVGSKDPGTTLRRSVAATMPSLSSNTQPSVSTDRSLPQHSPGAYSTRRAPSPSHHYRVKQWLSSPPVLSLRVGCPTPCPTPRCVLPGTPCSGASCLDRILNASARNVAVAATSMYLSYTGTKIERPRVLLALLTRYTPLRLRATARAERARTRTIQSVNGAR